MKLSESDLLDLLNTCPSFRQTCARTLANLLADDSAADRAPESSIVGYWDDLEEFGAIPVK